MIGIKDSVLLLPAVSGCPTWLLFTRLPYEDTPRCSARSIHSVNLPVGIHLHTGMFTHTYCRLLSTTNDIAGSSSRAMT